MKELLKLLPDSSKATRKADLMVVIEQQVHGGKLRALWDKLDHTQQLAVAETIYSDSGVFDAARFRAKHGALPVFGTKKEGWSYGKTPSLLRLFIYRDGRYGGADGGSAPDDLKRRLREVRAQARRRRACLPGRAACKSAIWPACCSNTPPPWG